MEGIYITVTYEEGENVIRHFFLVVIFYETTRFSTNIYSRQNRDGQSRKRERDPPQKTQTHDKVQEFTQKQKTKDLLSNADHKTFYPTRTLSTVADITSDLCSVLLVDRQSQGTTANLLVVSSTRSVALEAHAVRWGGGVSAITFVGVLHTSICIALAHAVVDALLNGQGTVIHSDGECARTKVITADFRRISVEDHGKKERRVWDVHRTANETPSSARDIGGIALGRSDDGGSTTAGSLGCPSGAALDGVAAGKSIKPSGGGLIDAWRDETIRDGVRGEELEERASFDDTGVVVATVDSLLKNSNIPSIDEITVGS